MTCAAARHGDANAYRHDRCRCPGAVKDHTRKLTLWRMQKLRGEEFMVDATGSHRRLQALMVGGWSRRHISRLLGSTSKSGTFTTEILSRQRIRKSTAARIAALYDRLDGVPGPSTAARGYALSRGWLGAAWWDDDTIDDPAYTPNTEDGEGFLDPVLVDRAKNGTLNDNRDCLRPYKVAAALELHRAGYALTEIALRMRVSESSVNRYMNERSSSNGQAQSDAETG